MKLFVESFGDGLLRILVDNGEDEPLCLPSVAKAHGTPLWPIVQAAVNAAPDAERDEHGLGWRSKASANKALAAAKRAAKGGA